MESPPSPCVDIFDDFDDAEVMDSAYCSQVSEAQFQEDIRSETDKALGELCLYLDQNPNVYAKVLRKRKQEEIESQGVVSYVKSKMMRVLHGEQYPQCLVSTSDCMQQTGALKAGMCKTFQYSQELKGNATRHSKRLAERRQAKYSKNSTKDDKNSASASAASLVAASANMGNGKKLDSQTNSRGELESSSSSDKSSASQENQSSTLTSSNADIRSAQESRVPNNQSKDKLTDKQVTANSKAKSGNDQTKEKDSPPTNTVRTVLQEADVQSNKPESFQPGPPPPPPPLPPHLINSFLPSKPSQKASELSKTPQLSAALASITNTTTVKIDGMTPVVVMKDVSKSPCKSRRSSPRVVPGSASRENSLARSRSEKNLLPPSRPESRSSMDGMFLTPMVTKRMKFHKRSHSNSSITSASSYESIHSELVSSNPLTRLKTTQIARSPGGTPVRTKSNDRLPSEPLHKALVTAMRSKFKNIKTPSPRSVNGSLNASNTSAFNSTFSP